MRLSSVLMRALESFNRLDPEIRSGLLPPTDGTGFCQRMAAKNPAEKLSLSHPVAAANDSIAKAKVDPYMFSPPGMELN